MEGLDHFGHQNRVHDHFWDTSNFNRFSKWSRHAVWRQNGLKSGTSRHIFFDMISASIFRDTPMGPTYKYWESNGAYLRTCLSKKWMAQDMSHQKLSSTHSCHAIHNLGQEIVKKYQPGSRYESQWFFLDLICFFKTLAGSWSGTSFIGFGSRRRRMCQCFCVCSVRGTQLRVRRHILEPGRTSKF